MFDGKWYLRAYESSKNDKCDPNFGHFEYDYLDASPQRLSEILYKQLPDYSMWPFECSWQKPILTLIHGDMPKDWPANKSDWEKITENRSYRWNSVCLNKDGQEVASFSDVIQPSYKCPDGYASQALDQHNFSDLSCYKTKDLGCSSDVVGRDLNTNLEFINSIGHIGIIIADPLCSSLNDNCGSKIQDNDHSPLSSIVIEVMNQKDVTGRNSVVFFDSYSGFINKVQHKFWGEKSNLPDQKLTLYQAGIIINSAIEQIEPPSTYSLNPFLFRLAGFYDVYILEGDNPEQIMWRKTTVYLPAIFRCDTFVNFCYQKADVKIPYGMYITPYRLFSSLAEFIKNPYNFSVKNIVKSIGKLSQSMEGDLEVRFQRI